MLYPPTPPWRGSAPRRFDPTVCRIFFFLFNGFRRQRFESFSGLRFACFGHESGLAFRVLWARILLLFEAFGCGFPRPDFELLSHRFQRSVPAYSRCVSCDVGRPGGYLFSFLFFLFSGFRRRRFESFSGLRFACFGHESGLAFRVLWARILLLFEAFGCGFPRPDFELLSHRFQRSVPAYSRCVSCDVGRPGGYLFSFLFFLFSGFRRRRFESFIGLCFACLGHESCCCSRLSEPFSKAKFRDDVGAIPDERTWL